MFCSQRRKNVDVIRRAIYDKRFAVMRANDAAEIWKQARFQIRVEQWAPVFRAENDMRQQMGEGVCHKISCGAAKDREKSSPNLSSPGWGGRNGLLNRGFLSPLPGLGKFAGGLTHSWRYGLLSRAAPQLKYRQ